MASHKLENLYSLDGVEELRRFAEASKYHREFAWEGFTAEGVINLLRAIAASGWDVMADQLTVKERDYAAKHGKLSARCLARLEKELS